LLELGSGDVRALTLPALFLFLSLADGLCFRDDILSGLTGTGDALPDPVTDHRCPFVDPLPHAVHDLFGMPDFRPLGLLLTRLLRRCFAGLFTLILTHQAGPPACSAALPVC
jgi:hypothetical protein